MIAVDSSAIVAVILDEPERAAYFDIVNASDLCLVSPVSVIESRMVVHGRRGKDGLRLLDAFLGLPLFQIVPPGPADVAAAYEAFLRYGKGSGHPARLNLGDVFSYALAKTRDIPLLFKGRDFALTDLRRP